jgi:hypothetical protein
MPAKATEFSPEYHYQALVIAATGATLLASPVFRLEDDCRNFAAYLAEATGFEGEAHHVESWDLLANVQVDECGWSGNPDVPAWAGPLPSVEEFERVAREFHELHYRERGDAYAEASTMEGLRDDPLHMFELVEAATSLKLGAELHSRGRIDRLSFDRAATFRRRLASYEAAALASLPPDPYETAARAAGWTVDGPWADGYLHFHKTGHRTVFKRFDDAARWQWLCEFDGIPVSTATA